MKKYDDKYFDTFSTTNSTTFDDEFIAVNVLQYLSSYFITTALKTDCIATSEFEREGDSTFATHNKWFVP